MFCSSDTKEHRGKKLCRLGFGVRVRVCECVCAHCPCISFFIHFVASEVCFPFRKVSEAINLLKGQVELRHFGLSGLTHTGCVTTLTAYRDSSA